MVSLNCMRFASPFSLIYKLTSSFFSHLVYKIAPSTGFGQPAQNTGGFGHPAPVPAFGAAPATGGLFGSGEL